MSSNQPFSTEPRYEAQASEPHLRPHPDPPPELVLQRIRGLLHDWEHNPHRQSPSHILNELVDLLSANHVPDPDDELPMLVPSVGHLLAEVERDLILRTVAKLGGNRTQAAHVLGISVRTMRNKLHRYVSDEPLGQPTLT